MLRKSETIEMDTVSVTKIRDDGVGHCKCYISQRHGVGHTRVMMLAASPSANYKRERQSAESQRKKRGSLCMAPAICLMERPESE